jgi:hypothetical protein
MPDPDSRHIELLERIAELLDRERLGLIDDPPGRRTIYAHRNSDSLWHFWDRTEEERIPLEKEAVRGQLTDCFCYVKSSAEGDSTKVRVRLQCAAAEYEIETSLNATSGRGMMSGLLEAGDAITDTPITIGVRPADKEQVLFMDVYTDHGGLQINGDHIGAGDEEAALQAVRTVRERLGLSPSPWDNRLADNTSAANPSGTPEASGTRQNGSRQKHDSEEMYDSNTKPSPEQAAKDLVKKARQRHGSGELAGEAALQGDPISQKLRGLVQYAGRDNGYQTRVLDALGVGGFDEVAVGQLGDVTQMIVDEEVLRENESFEPDDQLPF